MGILEVEMIEISSDMPENVREKMDKRKTRQQSINLEEKKKNWHADQRRVQQKNSSKLGMLNKKG